MKKIHPLLAVLAFLFSNVSFSQVKTCSSPDSEILQDLNSITKCSIKPVSSSGNSKKRIVRRVNIVVTSKRKALRRRKVVNSVNSLNANKTSSVQQAKNSVLSLANLKVKNKKIVPFTIIESKPLFSKCENTKPSLQAKCFMKELITHVEKNLNYPDRALWHQMEGTVLARFTVDENGTVVNVEAKGPANTSLLESEAIRVIKKLPKLIPGKFKGQTMSVNCGIPVSFKLPKEYKSTTNYKSLDKIIGFDEVETFPEFTACEGDNDKETCFHRGMIAHIQEHFKYPKLAVDDNIEGDVEMTFVISKSGNVSEIQARGPKNAKILERAAIKLIEKLPEFKPATKNGKPVACKYQIPISFKLN